MAFKSISITNTFKAPTPSVSGYTSDASLIGSGTGTPAPGTIATGSVSVSGFSTGATQFHFTDTLSQNFGASVTSISASSTGLITSTDGGMVGLSGSSHSYIGPAT